MLRIGLLVAATTMVATVMSAQTPARTTADGVYAAEQARRGGALYVAQCASCHGVDLRGGQGDGELVPALKRDNLLTGGDLGRFFGRVKASMPRESPGSLSDAAYADIVAYLMQQNGFPAGAEELPNSHTELSAIRIVRDGPVPNFSLVQTVGCLVRASDGGWTLTKSSAPVLAGAAKASAAELAESAAQPPGEETFRLVMPAAGLAQHAGRRVNARGLLVRTAADNRLNLTSLEVVSGTCE